MQGAIPKRAQAPLCLIPVEIHLFLPGPSAHPQARVIFANSNGPLAISHYLRAKTRHINSYTYMGRPNWLCPALVSLGAPHPPTCHPPSPAPASTGAILALFRSSPATLLPRGLCVYCSHCEEGTAPLFSAPYSCITSQYLCPFFREARPDF